MQEHKTIKDHFSKKEWEAMRRLDPAVDLMAMSSWQDPTNFSTLASEITTLTDIFPEDENITAKPSDINWRDLQKKSWEKYKTFGPLNAAVNSKADYVAQAGFSVYSDIYELDLCIRDIVYSYRNKLYARLPGWIIRMLAEGELFLLLVFNEEGDVTVRALEPNRIGAGTRDYGLITDPDDSSQTLFYSHKNGRETELIPDARFIIDPDYMTQQMKLLKGGIDTGKISKLTKGSSKFKKIGGYRRFVLHFKNFTGIYEYLRDTSSLSTVLEWVNLYVKAIKWGADHKRSLSAYTWQTLFNDTPAGKIAWHVWNKMSQAEKDATNLTKPLTPGSRIFTMPGMDQKCLNPQIPSMSGSNQDILNLAGAGARTPQDMFQGQTEGSTFASIKSTRPPLQAEIENLQSKTENFLRYEFFRVCLKAKLSLGGKLLDAANKKFQLPEFITVQEQWSDSSGKGKPKIQPIARELCEGVKFTWPVVQLGDTKDLANNFLGSKHAGMQSLGVARDTIAKRSGIGDLSRQNRLRAVEDELYGPIQSGSETVQPQQPAPPAQEANPKAGA